MVNTRNPNQEDIIPELGLAKNPSFLWHNVKILLRSQTYIIPVILVVVASYGFFLSHPSISVDDLSFDRYYFGELYAQGRITATLVMHILGLTDSVYHAWSIDFLGILLFFASGVFLSAFLMEFAKFKGSSLPYTIFTCLYLSNPLTSEIFGYLGTTIAIGGGMLLITFAIYSIYISIGFVGIRHNLYAVLLLVAVSSWYESILAVYVCIVFILLFLSYTEEKSISRWSTIWRTGLRFAIPLIIAVIVEGVISNTIIRILHIDRSMNAANAIQYFSNDLISTISAMSIRLIRDYFIMGFWYFPITMLIIALLASVIIGIYESLRNKSLIPCMLLGGMYLSILLISLIQGTAAGYRTCQVCYVFIAFIGMLIMFRVSDRIRIIATIVLTFFILFQVGNLNHWFELDNLRSKEEKFVAQQIGLELAQNYDISKPIVFVGDYMLSSDLLDQIMVHTDDSRYRFVNMFYQLGTHPSGDKYWRRIQQTNVNSYLSWGVDAFHEVNTELLKYLAFWGFVFQQGSREMYLDALSQIESMTSWPSKGSIVDCGEYIVVKLGEEVNR